MNANTEEQNMIKQLGMTASTLAMVGLGVGWLAPAIGSGDSDPSGGLRTIRVIEIDNEFEQVDVGDEGLSIGDHEGFTGDLMKGDKKVGHLGGTCQVTSVEIPEEQCLYTAEFKDGMITVQGLIRFQECCVVVLPITGGSGAYKHAQGQLRQGPGNPGFSLVFRLSD
jgi:hypothetical protein